MGDSLLDAWRSTKSTRCSPIFACRVDPVSRAQGPCASAVISFPVILLTTFDDPRALEEGISAGAGRLSFEGRSARDTQTGTRVCRSRPANLPAGTCDAGGCTDMETLTAMG